MKDPRRELDKEERKSPKINYPKAVRRDLDEWVDVINTNKGLYVMLTLMLSAQHRIFY